MKTAVLGGAGFTGVFIVEQLLSQGADVRLLVRKSSDLSALPLDKVEVFHGDASRLQDLRRTMEGCEALVSAVSLGFGLAPAIVESAQEAGVQRSLFFSSTSIFTSLDGTSKRTRMDAEKTIQSSPLRYTILRPTMIYGTRKDRNMSRLIGWLRRWPLIPVPGSGQFLQQPVYVGDVAKAAAEALESGTTEKRVYNISGAQPLTLDQVIDTICQLLDRKRVKLHLPAAPLASLLGLLERWGFGLAISREQVQRLNENKTFDHSPARADFGYRPRTFPEGVRLELENMKLLPRRSRPRPTGAEPPSRRAQ